VEFCYRTENSSRIITYQSLLASGAIQDYPLRTFESTGLNRMAIRYSLEVKHYALSTTAFDFWEQLSQDQSDAGGLIQIQVGAIPGNVSNIQDETEIVLGRFDVVDEEGLRVFFSPEDFEDQGYQVLDDAVIECDTTGLIRSRPEEVGDVLSTNSNLDIWFIDNGIDFELQQAVPILVYLPKRCSNCTYYGTNERPSFWVE